MYQLPLNNREVEDAMEVAAKIGQLLFSDVRVPGLQVAPRKAEQVNLIVDLVGDAAAVYSRSQMLERKIKREQFYQKRLVDAAAAIVIISERKDEK